ncbi:hypothetical protein DIPPA_32294 [Diplonema papillatum]|nr:hypothetical protein DIPPA_32294 [Diplonema papillatum]
MQYAAPRTEKPLLSGIFEDVRHMAKQAGLFGPRRTSPTSRLGMRRRCRSCT